MSLYIEQIRQLVVLQKVDSEIIAIKKRLTEAPKQLESLQRELDAKKDRMEQLNEKVEILNAQNLKLETEIEEDTSSIRKSKNKLMQVENTKEYHAMMREMDSLEKTNRMREEEKISLMEDLQDQQTLHEGIAAEVKEMENVLAQQRASIEAELSKMQRQLKKQEKEKKAACQQIPEPIFKRYDFIRTKLSNPVIVSVSEGICNGCHLKITPQKFIELQKGEQILSCPNCHRLIYWEDHFFTKEENTTKAKDDKKTTPKEKK
ncbi:MAG: C4-type zinc ribbon domain-containing protein [Desulfoplanes sp.]|nr:C4-type zinc ribbon domain-containing protein [Desulfoplanes sp.]MDD4649995.1 C4-type zinc ribbon domain-containing protein [Desulfoplanes sp.]